MTQRRIYVHFLPQAVESVTLAGAIVIVVDVLRASSTIATALYHGVAAITLATSPDEAHTWAAAQPSRPLLGGERKGIKIEGFDLGNSPSEYTGKQGRQVVFTTTNGTAAAIKAHRAAAIIFGSLVNFARVVRAVTESRGDVHILCAGTRGGFSRDDAAVAGMFAREFTASGSFVPGESDAVPAAIAMAPSQNEVFAILRDSIGGQDLHSLGLDADIHLCAQMNSVPVLPVVVSQDQSGMMRVESRDSVTLSDGWQAPLPPEVLIPGVHLRSVRPKVTQPNLTTPNLILRPLQSCDADSMALICGDIAVSSMTRTIPHPYTHLDAEKFIEGNRDSWALGRGAVWAMIETRTGELVGTCGGVVDPIDLRAEVGYMVRQDRWGKGYATEAMKAVADAFFTHLPLRKLTAHYLTSNPASGRVLEKAGFVGEGVLKKQSYKHGKEQDLAVVGLWRS